MKKSIDFVDAIVAVVLVLTTLTICYMSVTGAVVPSMLETIFWSAAIGIGMKKAPSLIGKE